MCGSPVFHYDHMIEYSTVEEHDPENITLLYPGHHHEKTVGRLPTHVVQKHNASPFHASAQSTGSLPLYFSAPLNNFMFVLGSNPFVIDLAEGKQSTVIEVDGGPVLAVKLADGIPLLRVSLRDADNRRVLRVRDNELTYALHKWDVQFVGNNLTIWDARRNIGLVVEFHDIYLQIVRGNFYANGYQFNVENGMLTTGGIALSNQYFNGSIIAGTGAAAASERPIQESESRIILRESQRSRRFWN